MEELKVTKEKIINNILEKKMELKKESRIDFREEVINKELKRNKSEKINFFQKICDEKYKEITEVKKQIKDEQKIQDAKINVKIDINPNLLQNSNNQQSISLVKTSIDFMTSQNEFVKKDDIMNLKSSSSHF